MCELVARWHGKSCDPQAHGSFARARAPRASQGARSTVADVVGAVTGRAGMMPGLSPMPLGACHCPWGERRHRTVPTASEAAFVFARLCNSCECNEPPRCVALRTANGDDYGVRAPRGRDARGANGSLHDSGHGSRVAGYRRRPVRCLVFRDVQTSFASKAVGTADLPLLRCV